MTDHRRARLIGYGVLAVIIVLIVTAFALGGGNESSGGSGESASPGFPSPPRTAQGGGAAVQSGGAGTQNGAAATAPEPVASGTSAPSGASASGHVANGSSESDVNLGLAVDAVTSTSVVKTGDLALQVARGQVQTTLTKLVDLTTSLGGYVSQSHTDTVLGSPTGELTLRMPVARFDAAVSSVEALGHVISLTTNAHDVTGQVVDLGARVSALQQTRSTYLTILGRARTIGTTLEVQQRVEDTQQQIEELQGELKVLQNQSADGTLTVEVSQPGAKKKPVVVIHHNSGGIGKAWHTSINRFSRGFDAIVSGLGPLLLAVLILAVLAALAGLGYRGVRRATSS